MERRECCVQSVCVALISLLISFISSSKLAHNIHYGIFINILIIDETNSLSGIIEALVQKILNASKLINKLS